MTSRGIWGLLNCNSAVYGVVVELRARELSNDLLGASPLIKRVLKCFVSFIKELIAMYRKFG